MLGEWAQRGEEGAAYQENRRNRAVEGALEQGSAALVGLGSVQAGGTLLEAAGGKAWTGAGARCTE